MYSSADELVVSLQNEVQLLKEEHYWSDEDILQVVQEALDEVEIENEEPD